MRTHVGAGLGALLAVVAIVSASGCTPGHTVPLYNLWASNIGPEDRVIVLGNGPDGSSTQPALLVPADGFPRSTASTTLGSQPGAFGAVLVYDLDCTLMARVEVSVGSFLLTLRDDQAFITSLERVTEPTGAALAADAPVNCPGGAPP